jgi:hypothetical protein
MKLFLKIIKVTTIGISIFVILLIAFIFIFYKFFYYHELNYIKKELQKNDKIEIVKVWGNEDVTFEDIYAILKVKQKGNLSIYNLSNDVNDFPNEVYIGEIGNYKFTHFVCRNGISSKLNIGTKSDFGKKTGIVFKNIDDVINHYDDIIKYIDRLEKFPKYNLYHTENYEETILFVDENGLMNYENLKKYYNSGCIADLQNEINKTWKRGKNCR